MQDGFRRYANYTINQIIISGCVNSVRVNSVHLYFVRRNIYVYLKYIHKHAT